MGISTIQSYCGAQIFEAVGLERVLVDRHFTGTASRIGGVGMDVLAQEALDRHARAWPAARSTSCCPSAASTHGAATASTTCGTRRRSRCSSTACGVERSRTAAPNGDARTKYDEYSRLVNDDAARRATLRGLLKFREDQQPMPLDEVEPAKEIVRRFATGAMSLGSISTEAHETLAIAMNRLGGTLEHRRGRGGPAALHARSERRPAPLGDQAGRLGALRRDDPLPRQRRPAADQDGPGRQARRGRPAARATRSTSTSAGSATRPRASA